MCSDRSSFLYTSSDSETLPTVSGYSDSKVQSVMKVNVSKVRNGVQPQKQFHSKVSDSVQPSRLGKSSSEFKSCDINNILQTLKRIDQKYSLNPVKELKVTPVENNILFDLHTNEYYRNSRNTKKLLNLKPNTVEGKLIQSPYTNGKSSDDSRLLSSVDTTPVHSREGIFNMESLNKSHTFEFNNNKSDKTSNKLQFSLRNQVTKIKNSSHMETHSKPSNDFTEQSAEPTIQTAFTRGENLSFESHEKVSDYTIFPNNITSKLEVKLEEMLKKSQVSENSKSEGNHTVTSDVRSRRQSNIIETGRTSGMPASENTRHQVSSEETKLEIHDTIKNSLSNTSMQENVSIKSGNNDDRFVSFCNKSAENIFANSETVHLDNTSFYMKKHTDQDLLSSGIPTSDIRITMHADAKKLPDVETNQKNLVVSEESNSSASSVGNYGIFKSGPYKIFTVEDLVAAHGVKILEEKTSSDVQNCMKDLKEDEIMSANEDNINNDTRKAVSSKSVLESDEEISEEIEEEIEAEGTDDLPHSSNTSIVNVSVKTNSSCGEMMKRLPSHSENKHTEKQALSKKDVSSEQVSISNRSLSSDLISNKSKQEVSSNVNTPSAAIKLESEDTTVSTAHSELSSSSPLDSQNSVTHRSNSNKTDMGPLSNMKYCSIGIQTDNNMARYSECDLHQSSFNQPVLPSDTGESHSFQMMIPAYTYYPRAMEFQG